MRSLFGKVLLAGLAAWGIGCHAGQHWVGVGDRVTTWTNSVSAHRVRLGVRDEGVYRVTAGEIAAASGVATSTVLGVLAGGGFALGCQRREVAWTTDGESLYFYGVETPELFAPENVYWLSFGQGARMASCVAVPEAGVATNRWFMRGESFRPAFLAPWDARDRRSTNATLTNVLNFGEWIAGSATESLRAKTATVALPGFCETAATGVVARVSVVSYRDFVLPDNHVCEVLLNGASVGSTAWSNEQAVVLDVGVPWGVVTNGPVQLTIRNGLTARVNDFMLLDVELIYPCAYRASEGSLLCTGGEAGTASASGFGSGLVRVWDVTEADQPLELDAPVWQGSDGTWQADFLCGGADARYAVFDEAAGCFAPSVSGVRDTDWNGPAEMPELAIVIPPRRWVTGFDVAVRELAAFRSAQGLSTRVLDAEEIYNAFSDGLAHPEAFQRFSAAGVTNGPSQTLRYLLFAGYASSDYKHEVFGLGEKGPYPALFPLYLYPQVEESASTALLLPNDVVLGNAVGGAMPEVAVGRFIATNAVELQAMADKTVQYERAATWKNKTIFTADWENIGEKYVNFTQIASNTATRFASAGWRLAAFYPGPTDSYLGQFWDGTYYDSNVLAELLEGAGFFYYVGHSNDDLAGSTYANKLFGNTTLQQAEWSFAPVALLMGCRMGRWTLLELKNQTPCIAEAGVRNRASGFAAVISASGYMQASEAIGFSNGFGAQVEGGAGRLGDAWLGAFAFFGDAAAEDLQHMTLLGDPSLPVRAGYTARGTPTAWLLAHGLTEAGADLLDPDGDGFATWMEVQAQTSHEQGGVRVRSFAWPAAGADGLPLAFEVAAGGAYRVMTSTNLLNQEGWEAQPWRPVTGGAWSWAGIPGDWPLKQVEVPHDPAGRQRFFKIEAIGGE